MSNEKPTIWSRKIATLERMGMPLKDIAKKVGAKSSQAICEVKKGRSKEPRGMVAVKLYLLHQRMTAKDQAQINGG